MSMKCEDCKWWDGETERDEWGQCRRLAPRHILGDVAPNLSPPDAEEAHWPYTKDKEWCGEFEAKE